MSIAERARSITGEQIVISDEALEALIAGIRGQVIRPGDAGYDETRLVWNGMIDKYPALIVRASGTADVAATVRFACENELLLTVRGNGHNVAGNAIADGALMLDLSTMRAVQVDPAARIARVQPGANWGDLDRETQLHGLATPGGQVSTTGIAGFTLVGGMGYIRRKYGLACDNLIGAEVVLADGSVVYTSETENSDLLWGLRGGGGNFGVVTSFEYRLYPLGPEVAFVSTIYALDDVEQVLRGWRDYSEQAPDEVTPDFYVWGMPAAPDVPAEMVGMPIVFIAGMYAGPADEGERMLKPLRELATPIADQSGIAPYLQVQCASDSLFPNGLLNYWKSVTLKTLDEDGIKAVLRVSHERPSPQTLIALRYLGGAISRVPEEATAYGNRSALYNLSIDATWTDPFRSEEMIGWTRRVWSEIQQETGAGVYLNFAGFAEENSKLAELAYRSNHDRLVALKRAYDPTNLFRTNVNIRP
ncbi:MAG TPA: FAD-binding oxidoreductase [Thermomicrobiales bacterium]|nr:FAD-binding oxidoreductase [Thermomicrobiales bacterium]